jgi:ATP-dependent RNA helicase RhlE
VDKSRKRELLSALVKSGRIYQALVFTRTKHGADRLAHQLEQDGITAVAIHGNKSQPQRIRALNQFKQNKVAILVATEVAARGLDIESLPHVVNYELPMVAADYVHRIGRTGRAGEEGDAISLVSVDEQQLLADIERLLGHRIETEVITGFEPDPTIRPEPISRRQPRHQPRPTTHQPFQPRLRGDVEFRRGDRPQRRGERPRHGERPWQPRRNEHRHDQTGRPTTLPGERLARG